MIMGRRLRQNNLVPLLSHGGGGEGVQIALQATKTEL